MKDTQPVTILKKAALEAVGDAAKRLRLDGWDAQVSVVVAEEENDHFYEVVMVIAIGHNLPIPDEAR